MKQFKEKGTGYKTSVDDVKGGEFMGNVFKAIEIPTFQYKDLHGKVLKIIVYEDNEVINVSGIEEGTGNLYVIFIKVK